MKNQILNSQILRLVTASVLCQGSIFASDKTLQPEPITSQTTGYDLQIVDGALILPRGKVEATLPNIVDALRDRFTDANIVVAPGLSKLKVGDLKMRAGRLGEELEAVRVACGERFEIQPPGNLNGPVDPSTGLPLDWPHSLNGGLFILRESPLMAQNQKVVEAFNVGPFLEWRSRRSAKIDPSTGVPVEGSESHEQSDAESLREISATIAETIRDLKGDAGDQPKTQYHAGATLLVVIGTGETVEIARKIINALPGMPATSEEITGRFGANSPRYQAPTARGGRERNAEDAFRARYGLAPRPDPNTTNPAPGTGQ
jgi:hypothetical protein